MLSVSISDAAADHRLGKILGDGRGIREAFDKSVRLGGQEPFNLPKRWLEGKSKLDLSTPFDFV